VMEGKWVAVSLMN